MRGRPSATARRIFVASVALLVVNDWLLKGAGVLPGWLTGKLSDVAGVLVAPVVLAALLALARVPVGVARAVAVAAVGLALAALKLDAGIAAAYDAAVNAATRGLGVPLVAHTTPDPTDLAVLPLLVVGAWLAARLARDRQLLRSGALSAALLACAATSPTYMRLDPHWGFADRHLDRMWGARLDDGAIVVQFGRQSGDGAFELGVELAAREGALSLDATDVALEAPGERIAAEAPAGQPRLVQVRAGDTARFVYLFRPAHATWPKGANAALNIALSDGGRRRSMSLGLSFDERIAAWQLWPSLR